MKNSTFQKGHHSGFSQTSMGLAFEKYEKALKSSESADGMAGDHAKQLKSNNMRDREIRYESKNSF